MAKISLLAFTLLIITTYSMAIKNKNNCSEKDSTLQMLAVLFRHGNRTANGVEELYPKDPYLNMTYYPFGLGQLTNAGKIKEYGIGKALRERYNHFLGQYYYPLYVDAISTNYNRTKMSLQLVLAGLYPPRDEEVWNKGLNWQPIPFNYLPTTQDKVLIGVNCPHYQKLYNEHNQSPQQQAEYKLHQATFDYISKNTGLNITSFENVYHLFFGLSTEEEWGFKLPKWTAPVWPQKITDLAVKEYFVATATTELRQLAVGYFLEKFINDVTDKIKGNDKKIYLYSAHENNVAELLLVLGVFEPPHVPTYGSYITFEIHKIDGVYGIKIYYENYSTNKPRLLKLPACDSFCRFDKFAALVDEYIPSENFCGNKKCDL